MFETLLSTILTALQLWNQKERTKYVDKILSLKKDWYDEYSKPENIRSDGELARIQLELQLTCDAWVAAAGAAVTSH